MTKCGYCGKQITKKNDVNALAFLGIVPKYFCNNCYSSKERGFARHFLYAPRQPINGSLYIIGLIIATILTVILVPLIILSGSQNTLFFKIIFFSLWIVLLIWQWIMYLIVKNKISHLSH